MRIIKQAHRVLVFFSPFIVYSMGFFLLWPICKFFCNFSKRTLYCESPVRRLTYPSRHLTGKTV